MHYSEIFATDPVAFGPPENPRPHGFLVLAKAGRDIWNSWRTDHPTELDASTGKWLRAVRWHADNPPEHVNISNQPGLNFSGFLFGDGADFTGQQFSRDMGVVKFEGARFGDDARFDSTAFHFGVSFRGASFGSNASFRSVSVTPDEVLPIATDWICFENATFGDKARISGLYCAWNYGLEKMPVVSFKGVKFGDGARFLLGGIATPFRLLDISEAVFGKDADFSESFFKGMASFRGSRFGANTTFAYALFSDVDFEQCHFGDWVDFKGDDFRWISFAQTVFEGRAHFSNRIFRAHTNFSRVRFGQVPLFHDCKLHQDTEFDVDADSFPSKPEGTTTAARGYRTLKLAMSTHQATREEQFFFRREMQEERAVLWSSGRPHLRLRSVLYWLYGALSDYGASVRRPAMWFLVLCVAFAGMYAASSQSATLWIPGREFDGAQTVHWIAYSFVNSLPLGGVEEASRDLRGALFGVKPAPWLPVVLVMHKVLSLLFLFLIGLALRNLFKLK